jgi:hypothetical protein
VKNLETDFKMLRFAQHDNIDDKPHCPAAPSTTIIEREDSKKTGKNHRLSVKSRKVQSQKPSTFLHIV